MKIINRLVLAISFVLVSTVSTVSLVNADGHLPVVAGEVKKVKPKSGKITIKHEEIPNLDMPGMTMVFRVDDSALISELKKGDMVNFTTEEKDGKMYIIEINLADK